MTKNIEKYLWTLAVSFITYLLLGSFVVSGNIYDLSYLAILYTFIIIIKIVDRK